MRGIFGIYAKLNNYSNPPLTINGNYSDIFSLLLCCVKASPCAKAPQKCIDTIKYVPQISIFELFFLKKVKIKIFISKNPFSAILVEF